MLDLLTLGDKRRHLALGVVVVLKGLVDRIVRPLQIAQRAFEIVQGGPSIFRLLGGVDLIELDARGGGIVGGTDGLGDGQTGDLGEVKRGLDG